MRRFRRFTEILFPFPFSSRCEIRIRLETLLGRHGSRDDPIPTSNIIAMHTLHKTILCCIYRTELYKLYVMKQILYHNIQKFQL